VSTVSNSCCSHTRASQNELNDLTQRVEDIKSSMDKKLDAIMSKLGIEAPAEKVETEEKEGEAEPQAEDDESKGEL